MNDYFISCDWGSSNFRLRLIERESLKVVMSSNSEQGVARNFEEWKESREPREEFFLKIIRGHIDNLQRYSPVKPDEFPLIISGMASSSIGLRELPYAECPTAADGSGFHVAAIEHSLFKNRTWLVSGVRSPDDMMRGEETQVAGVEYGSGTELTVILPGTHSKHVKIAGGKMTGIKTYMTGEFFELISKHSILSHSVRRTENFWGNSAAFKKGVRQAVKGNFLNNIFSLRVKSLFDKLSAGDGYQYLSGMLIGTELKDVEGEISLVGNIFQADLYRNAIALINPSGSFNFFDVEVAIVNGHSRILESIL